MTDPANVAPDTHIRFWLPALMCLLLLIPGCGSGSEASRGQTPTGPAPPVASDSTRETGLMPNAVESKNPRADAPPPDPGEIVLEVRLGPANEELAGKADDPCGVTDGFPPAYEVDGAGIVHVLDSAKRRIVRFRDGKFLNSVDLSNLPGLKEGPHELIDMSLLAGDKPLYAILDRTAGLACVIDDSGSVIRTIEGRKGTVELSIAGAGDLYFLDEKRDEVSRFGVDGDMTGCYDGFKIRPWLSPGGFLFFIDGSGADTENVYRVNRLDSSSGEALNLGPVSMPLEDHFLSGIEIAGVLPDDGVVLVLLMGMSKSGSKGPDAWHDQSIAYRKFFVRIGPDGKQKGRTEVAQSELACRVTPRFHRIGPSGSLLTARIEGGTYRIYSKSF